MSNDLSMSVAGRATEKDAEMVRMALAEAGFSNLPVRLEDGEVYVDHVEQTYEEFRAVWRAFFLSGQVCLCLDCYIAGEWFEDHCPHEIGWA